MNRYWTTMQTRQGWSWTCTHPRCERAVRGGYGCRCASQDDADKAAQRHILEAHR